MKQEDTPIEALRERLTETLADWGTEMSTVLQELEFQRQACERLEANTATRERDFADLQEQVSAQAKTIEVLKRNADDAAELRKSADGKDAELEHLRLELERLNSEVDSKQELIRALRRDGGSIDSLKAELKAKDASIERLQNEQRDVQERMQTLEAENQALRESEENQADGDSAELEAIRAELEARKTLIKSLRTDVERVDQLEARLEEKREVIATLEESINRHADTIAELKRSSEQWKRKYQSLRGGTTSTSSELPMLSDTGTIEEAVFSADAPERTIAIDMREPLLEARRKSGTGRKKR